MRIIIALVLLGVAGFCVFGFAATFEPMGWQRFVWRTVYAVVGTVCLLVVIRTLAKSRAVD